MARVREITIKPPAAGVVRRFDFQSQAPFSAVDALNFLPVDLKTGRRRPSLRPRLVAIETDLPNNPVRGLAQVNVAIQQDLVRGLFAVTNAKLYRYETSGWVDEGGAFDTNRHISMTPFLRNLYIAGEVSGRPQVYNCTTDTRADIAISPGAVDAVDDSTLVTTWADRLVWAGQASAPHVWQMSRVGAPLDYEYNLVATDVMQAVASTNLDGGNIGEKITALIPHNRECIMFGATDSLHILRGNPMQGGRIEILSHVVGPIHAAAWCKTGDDATVMLTRNGLYAMAPGCGTAPVQLSKQRIPDELMGIDSATYEAHLAYDARFDGVHIYITEKAGASTGREAWWLDWEEGGYWPLELTTTEQPTAVMRFDPLDGENVSGVLLGGSGGDVRQFDRTSAASIASGYLYLGPIRISPTRFHKGLIQRMTATFGNNTTDTAATVAVYCAEDGEAAYDAAVADSAVRKFSTTIGELTDNLFVYPRVGGHAAVIKIAMSSGTSHISLEEIVLSVLDQGTNR